MHKCSNAILFWRNYVRKKLMLYYAAVKVKAALQNEHWASTKVKEMREEPKHLSTWAKAYMAYRHPKKTIRCVTVAIHWAMVPYGDISIHLHHPRIYGTIQCRVPNHIHALYILHHESSKLNDTITMHYCKTTININMNKKNLEGVENLAVLVFSYCGS